MVKELQPGIMKTKVLLISLLVFGLLSCENEPKPSKPIVENPPITNEKPNIERPDFNADSAYKYVEEQVDFGPRFPNNEAHGKCAVYLKDKLASFGWNATIQEGSAKTFNNKSIIIKNIIGEYKPELKDRILLFAHWDSRPFADQDQKDMTKPILGANDGASGVGVLLEVARQVNIKQPNIGVDIIFFDAEDYGQPSSGMMISNDSKSWCLGSQFWAKTPHKKGYKANYGILLDMVGSSDAYFTYESISMKYAPEILNLVWSNAHKLGHGKQFVSKETFFVGVDDHQFVNEIAGIPSIDIIHHDRFTGNFHPSWHTHNDNMDIIDKNTLKAVGETLLFTIYSE